MKPTTLASLTLAISLLPFAGCKSSDSDTSAGHGSHGSHQSGQKQGTVRKAVAYLNPTQGNKVQGTVWFTRERDGIRVQAEITGLTPGKHGFHIHEKGDCSAPDATSAGGHFNPTGTPHSGPDSEARHAGDFGNVEADSKGVAKYSRLDKHITFDGPNSILGRGVIVHANPDDLSSQPAGNAGARVACGVIMATQQR
jgi:Cu-Zn family superoxide dismutase